MRRLAHGHLNFWDVFFFFIYSHLISSPVIVIFPDHRKFLAFAWDLDTGIFRYFLLCLLPFGLLSAFLYFQQSSPTAVESKKKPRYPYCLFFWLWSRRRSRSRSGQNLQFADCPCRIPNEEKSLWEPVQIFLWLGLHLNITLSMEVLEPRMNALLNCLRTWRLCLHISLPPQSTFNASRV